MDDRTKLIARKIDYAYIKLINQQYNKELSDRVDEMMKNPSAAIRITHEDGKIEMIPINGGDIYIGRPKQKKPLWKRLLNALCGT